MSIHKLSLKLFGGLAVFALSGCSSDDLGKVFDGNLWGNNDEIGFVVYSGGVKGSETNSSNYLSQVSDFQVWGYFAAGATGDGVTAGGRYLGTSDTQGVKIVGDGSGAWDYSSSGDKKYWPTTAAPLNFQAVTPSSDASFTLENSVSSSLAHVVANVTVPTSNAAQKDIMFASANGVTKNTAAGKVSLQFKHAMSLISFSGRVVNTNYIVELGSVNLHNINNKGKVGYLSSADAGSAVNLGSSVTTGTVATYSLGMASDKTLSSTTAKNITASSGSLIMLPQTTTKWNTSSSSAVSIATADQNKQSYISVTYKVKTTSGLYIIGSESSYSTLYIPFEANWAQGKKYNYTLVFGSGSGGYDTNGKPVAQNIKFQVSEDAWVGVGNDTTIPDWEYVLDVVGTSDYSYAGGSNTYQVTSYKSFKGSGPAVSWSASFSTDGGTTWSSTAPSWLTAFTTSGDGGTSASSYTATVAKAEGTVLSSESASDKLKAASAVADYDLSTHTVAGASCSMTTANCYLVHAAGTYKLPLVYGNAIKNGATNSEAYNPTGTSGDYFLKPFVNHADAGITDPWLKNNGATPDGASLIWQDSNGLISAVGISGDHLTFTVPSANIAEGNAVIAATKGGTVVWSWHIWVTPETLSTLTSIAGTSYTYKVTHVNLGWVGSGNTTTTNYNSRSCLVKITQREGGLSKTFSVVQNGGDGIVETPKRGVNTYYQFGRKDPKIPAAAYNSKSNHAAYDISGSSVSPTLSQTSVAIGTTIQNPLIHYYSSSTEGPYSTYQYNLWDANNSATGQIKTKTVKTIYDPCPPGFCIPTSDLWYKMSGNSGGSSSTGTWDSTNLGRLWTWTGNTPNVYFPASGLRNYSNGSLNYVGSFGFYWSASPYGGNDGHSLYLDSSYWDWDNSYRSYGFPVRAVLEE